MIKHILVLTLLLMLGSMDGIAQDHETQVENILDAPENWLKERLPFPLSFAPSIEYSGFEDLRFAPTWSKVDSPDFWTYAFVWCIDDDPKLDQEVLMNHLKSYYDGLMRIDERNKGLDASEEKIENTIVSLSKQINSKDMIEYIGTIHTFDGFHTKKPIIFNVKVEKGFCENTGKHLIFFYISPQEIGTEVWKKFEAIGLNIDC